MLTDADMPSGYVLEISTHLELKITDEKNRGFYLTSNLEDEGDLWFSLETRNDDVGTRSIMRGKVLFDLMIRHFDSRISCIIGYWTSGDNWSVFQERMNHGCSMELAAMDTWTGQQAERHGFGIAKNVVMVDSDGYLSIKVEFHPIGGNP